MPTPVSKAAEEPKVAASSASSSADESATKPYRLRRGVWNLSDAEGNYETKTTGDIVHLTEEEAQRHRRNIEAV